ncbi:MAG: hypothetical protein QM820_07775 [Minicystis sp.]
MEAQAAVAALTACVRTVERLPGEVRYNRVLTVRGPVELRLRFTRR